MFCHLIQVFVSTKQYKYKSIAENHTQNYFRNDFRNDFRNAAINDVGTHTES